MGCLLRASSVLQGQGVLSLRHGPLTGAVQEESQLQEQASKLEAGIGGGKQNPSLKLVSSLAVCLLRARSLLQGQRVLVLRQGPLTGAVQEPAARTSKQDGSWPWRKASKVKI